MAEGGGDTDRPRKKLNTEKHKLIALNGEKRKEVFSAIETLKAKRTGLSMLKLEYCDAQKPYSFSDSHCSVRRNPPKLFKFFSVFKRGEQVLMSYLNSGYTDSLTAQERVALERLFVFINNIEGTSQIIRWPKNPIQKEIDWLLQLCHHILKGLSKDGRNYIVDDRAQFLGSADLSQYGCPCCRQVLTGVTGDTSIGNTSVWHGRVDILMGPLAVIDAKNADLNSQDIRTSSFEIKQTKLRDKQTKLRDLPQLVAETIVFAFLQNNLNPNLKNSLIPTIGISYQKNLFQFYDPVQDILIDSELFDLFDENDECLAFETILALWLAMNYELFCTGITKKMTEANFKADFTTLVKPEIIEIYKNQLSFGGCGSAKPNIAYVDLDEYSLESDEDQ